MCILFAIRLSSMRAVCRFVRVWNILPSNSHWWVIVPSSSYPVHVIFFLPKQNLHKVPLFRSPLFFLFATVFYLIVYCVNSCHLNLSGLSALPVTYAVLQGCVLFRVLWPMSSHFDLSLFHCTSAYPIYVSEYWRTPETAPVSFIIHLFTIIILSHLYANDSPIYIFTSDISSKIHQTCLILDFPVYLKPGTLR